MYFGFSDLARKKTDCIHCSKSIKKGDQVVRIARLNTKNEFTAHEDCFKKMLDWDLKMTEYLQRGRN